MKIISSTERLFIPCILLASLAVVGCGASSSDGDEVRVEIEPSLSPKCFASEKTFEAENRDLTRVCGSTPSSGGAGGGGGGGGGYANPDTGSGPPSSPPEPLPDRADAQLKQAQGYAACMEACGTTHFECTSSWIPLSGTCGYVVLKGIHFPAPPSLPDTGSCVTRFRMQCQLDFINCTQACQRQIF
jgi:hypothetical protein